MAGSRAAVVCYGSGPCQDLFALALKRFHKDTHVIRVTHPKLGWTNRESGKPGTLMVAPPLVSVFEELDLWPKLQEKAIQMHYLSQREGDNTVSFETSHFAEWSTSFRWIFRGPTQRLKELALKGFWLVETATLQEVLRDALYAHDIPSYYMELRDIETLPATASSPPPPPSPQSQPGSPAQLPPSTSSSVSLNFLGRHPE
eukprot:RCo016755